MLDVEAWARFILQRLQVLEKEAQEQLVLHAFEDVRNGLLSLLSVLPGYGEKAVVSAKIMADSLNTVKHAVMSGWDASSTTPLTVVPVAMPEFGNGDRRLSMSDRITNRGASNILEDLKQAMKALDKLIYYVHDEDVADAGQRLHTIESALEDAIILAKHLSGTSSSTSSPDIP